MHVVRNWPYICGGQNCSSRWTDDHLKYLDAHYSTQPHDESDDLKYSNTQYTDTINYDLSPHSRAPPSFPVSPQHPSSAPAVGVGIGGVRTSKDGGDDALGSNEEGMGVHHAHGQTIE